MKKQLIWAIALGVALFTTEAQAQNNRAGANGGTRIETPEGNKGNKGNRGKGKARSAQAKAQAMTKKYGLNADQETRVEQLFASIKSKQMAFDKNTASKEERKAHAKAIREEREAGLQAILTPAQYQQYQGDKAQYKENKGKGKNKGKNKGKGKNKRDNDDDDDDE